MTSLHSQVFVFLFLPVAVVLFWIIPARWQAVRQGFLLLASLLFYLWNSPASLPFFLIWSGAVYLVSRHLQKRPSKPLFLVTVGAATLFFALTKSLDAGLISPESSIHSLILTVMGRPIGYSFLYLIQLSYLIDSQRGRLSEGVKAADYALQVGFFGRLVSGPVVRFNQLTENLSLRSTLAQTASGLRRFARGFIKKVLIADILGQTTAQIAALPGEHLSTASAWTGILFFTLQLYYDFSGYTDMALGLGEVFGIRLPENFNFPYISSSIGEFWRRWHMSFSTWFRDYIFFPLERSKNLKPFWRQEYSVLAVFLLTGLWHGFTAGFVLWGLLHGLTILMENSFLNKIRQGWFKPLRHTITLLVIVTGWVFFLEPTLPGAVEYLGAMFVPRAAAASAPMTMLTPIGGLTWLAFGAGIIFSLPVGEWLRKAIPPFPARVEAVGILMDVTLLALFGFSVAVQLEATYMSFIYGGF